MSQDRGGLVKPSSPSTNQYYDLYRQFGIAGESKGNGTYIGMEGWANPGRTGVPYKWDTVMAASAATGMFTPFTSGKPLYQERGAAQGWLMSSASNEEFLAIQSALREVGLINGEYYIGERSDGKTRSAWNELLAMSNRQGITWSAMLGRLGKTSSSNVAKQKKNPWGDGPRRVTTTNVNRTYRETSREDAQAMLLNMWRNYYGRDPKNTEITSFQKALNAKERANPTITTTTTTTDRLTGSSSSTVKVKQAPDASSSLLDQTRKASAGSVESKAYKIGQYTDVLLRMVGLDAGAGEEL